MAIAFGNSPEGRAFVRERITPALERQKSDQDADVRYFATRALQRALASDV